MPPPSVAVVTPIWRPTLSEEEFFRVQLTWHSTPRWDHIALVPEGLDITELAALLPGWTFRSSPNNHLESIRSYSSWLLQEEFYTQFADFDFIIIAQLDSVLLAEPPAEAFDYDYLGAPWDPPWRVVIAAGQMRIVRFLGRTWGKRIVVGNGGLSVRRISAFRAAAEKLATFVDRGVLETANEDAVWSYYASRLNLSLAPETVASCFVDLRSDSALDLAPWTGVHGVQDDWDGINAALRKLPRS